MQKPPETARCAALQAEYDTLTLSPDYRFVRVVSPEGVFYDLICKWRVREHIFRLRQRYPDAQTIRRAFVPPCVCRDFTALEGPEAFAAAVWRGGSAMLFPLTPMDQRLLASHTAEKPVTR